MLTDTSSAKAAIKRISAELDTIYKAHGTSGVHVVITEIVAESLIMYGVDFGRLGITITLLCKLLRDALNAGHGSFEATMSDPKLNAQTERLADLCTYDTPLPEEPVDHRTVVVQTDVDIEA